MDRLDSVVAVRKDFLAFIGMNLRVASAYGVALEVLVADALFRRRVFIDTHTDLDVYIAGKMRAEEDVLTAQIMSIFNE